jgi:hypothetical protein
VHTEFWKTNYIVIKLKVSFGFHLKLYFCYHDYSLHRLCYHIPPLDAILGYFHGPTIPTAYFSRTQILPLITGVKKTFLPKSRTRQNTCLRNRISFRFQSKLSLDRPIGNNKCGNNVGIFTFLLISIITYYT